MFFFLKNLHPLTADTKGGTLRPLDAKKCSRSLSVFGGGWARGSATRLFRVKGWKLSLNDTFAEALSQYRDKQSGTSSHNHPLFCKPRLNYLHALKHLAPVQTISLKRRRSDMINRSALYRVSSRMNEHELNTVQLVFRQSVKHVHTCLSILAVTGLKKMHQTRRWKHLERRPFQRPSWPLE